MADEYLRWLQVDRECKPSTVRDHRSTVRAQLVRAFGSRAVRDITTEGIEGWQTQLGAATGILEHDEAKVLTCVVRADRGSWSQRMAREARLGNVPP